jgi:muramidase (phage lysozyme)
MQLGMVDVERISRPQESQRMEGAITRLPSVQHHRGIVSTSPQSSPGKASHVFKLPSHFWQVVTPIGVVCWGFTIGVQGYKLLQPPIQIVSSDVVVQSSGGSGSGGSNPEIAKWKVWRAFLRGVIFTAEGTWHPDTKLDPYRTQALSYRQIPESYAYKKHPYWSDKIIPCAQTSAGWICSACTGAAQWHPDTWESVKNANKNKFWFKGEGEFSPSNQDMATLYKLEETRSFQTLMDGLRVKDGKPVIDRRKFEIAVSRSAGVWASLPRYHGDETGAYGQGARSFDKLWNSFQSELQREEKLWQAQRN